MGSYFDHFSCSFRVQGIDRQDLQPFGHRVSTSFAVSDLVRMPVSSDVPLLSGYLQIEKENKRPGHDHCYYGTEGRKGEYNQTGIKLLLSFPGQIFLFHKRNSISFI